MKRTINESEFVDTFLKVRPDNFSLDGLKALFEYLEQVEEDMNEEQEFDPIAICCDYSEYENLADYNKQHGDSFKALEEIEEQTAVIRIQSSDRFIALNH